MSYMVELESLLRPTGRSLTRVPSDRRGGDRIPLQLACSELVGERMHRALVGNLSPSGVYVDRVFGAGLDRLQLGREDRQVQLEFTLPSSDESIWALCEVCHDELGALRGQPATVHGTGMRFTALAGRHARLIEDFVFERRRRALQSLLDRVLDRRYRRDRRARDRRAA
jgi:hypothetical protein